jgi:hypothetical protein
MELAVKRIVRERCTSSRKPLWALAASTAVSGSSLLKLLNLTKRGGFDIVKDVFIEEEDEAEVRAAATTVDPGDVSDDEDPSTLDLNCCEICLEIISCLVCECQTHDEKADRQKKMVERNKGRALRRKGLPDPDYEKRMKEKKEKEMKGAGGKVVPVISAPGPQKMQREPREAPPDIMTFGRAPRWDLGAGATDETTTGGHLKELVKSQDVMSTLEIGRDRGQNAAAFTFAGEFAGGVMGGAAAITMMDEVGVKKDKFMFVGEVAYLIRGWHEWGTMHKDMADVAFLDEATHMSELLLMTTLYME